MKYKIKDAGIDVRNYDSIFPDLGEISNFVTSPNSGNDYILEPGIDDEGDLIVTMEKDSDPSLLLYHLQAIHRPAAEIVLIEQGSKYLSDYKFLKDSGYIEKLGYYLPADISSLINEEDDQIEVLGVKFDPLHFNMELIKYAENKGIKLIGFPDFNNTTLPHTFILSFYSRYCDCVIVDSDINKLEYLEELIKYDYEAPKEVEMTKSVDKKGKLNIFSSIKLGEDIIIPLSDIKTIINPGEVIFGLGKEIENIKEEENPNKFEEIILNLWEGLKAERDKFSREELIDLIRYRTTGLITKRYNLGALSRYSFILVIRESKKVCSNYLFYIDENKNFYIRNLKNTA